MNAHPKFILTRIFALASMVIVAAGCSQSYSLSTQTLAARKPSNTLASAGTGTANGGGFEGKLSVYTFTDMAHPCSESDSRGVPVPNSEVNITEYSSIKSAQLVREACVALDLPKAIPISEILPATDGSGGINYRGVDFVPAATPPATVNNNLFSFSEGLEQSYWDHLRITATADAAQAPDGTATAELLRESASSGQHELARNLPGPADSAFSCSVFVKNAGRTRGTLQLYEDSTNNMLNTKFDLSNGSSSPIPLGSGNIVSSQLRPVGGGWFRATISGTLRTTASSNFVVCALYLEDSSGNAVYAGDGSSGVFAWGFQLENSASPTPYYSATTRQAIGLP
jgi:hypothetical protein